jgi:hypothetical protein
VCDYHLEQDGAGNFICLVCDRDKAERERDEAIARAEKHEDARLEIAVKLSRECERAEKLTELLNKERNDGIEAARQATIRIQASIAHANEWAKALSETLDDAEAYLPIGEDPDHAKFEYACPWCEKRVNALSDEPHEDDCTYVRMCELLVTHVDAAECERKMGE